MGNLAITRKPGERIRVFLPDGSEFDIVFEHKGGWAFRLVFLDAPEDVRILRHELLPRREK